MSGRYRQIAEQATRALLGEPNRRLSTKKELRYGRQGSLSVVIAGDKAGLWCDHERQVGGGLVELGMHARGFSRGAAIAWLSSYSGKHR